MSKQKSAAPLICINGADGTFADGDLNVSVVTGTVRPRSAEDCVRSGKVPVPFRLSVCAVTKLPRRHIHETVVHLRGGNKHGYQETVFLLQHVLGPSQGFQVVAGPSKRTTRFPTPSRIKRMAHSGTSTSRRVPLVAYEIFPYIAMSARLSLPSKFASQPGLH